MTTFERFTRRTRRALGALAVATACLGAAGSMAPAPASDLCVSMSGSGGAIAGIQADFNWDSSCMAADKGSGSSGRCTADPSTGKDIRAALKGGAGMKAIFFSMADTNPIPDGDLFCCSFTRLGGGGGNPCCGLTMGNVLGSDSVGKAIPANNFSLLVTLDGQTCAVNEASGSQPAPAGRGLQRSGGATGGGIAPPVVSAPGGAGGGTGTGQPGTTGGGQPAGRGLAPAQPAGMDQVQRALEQLAPREAPTVAAEATAPAMVGTPQRTAIAGTPTVKPKATEAHGTPAAPQKTPSAAATRGSKTPGATPEVTPKAEHKGDGK